MRKSSDSGSMKNTNSFRLKRPIVVTLLACSYILTGPIHVMQVLLFGHDSEWYSPVRWVEIFAGMTTVDQAICFLIPIAGLGLLVQRKRSWAMAIAGLFMAFAQNIYC